MELTKQTTRVHAVEQGGGFPNRRIRKIAELIWSCTCGQRADYYRTGEVQRMTCPSCGSAMALRLRADVEAQ